MLEDVILQLGEEEEEEECKILLFSKEKEIGHLREAVELLFQQYWRFKLVPRANPIYHFISFFLKSLNGLFIIASLLIAFSALSSNPLIFRRRVKSETLKGSFLFSLSPI